jgi:hypothetical protein
MVPILGVVVRILCSKKGHEAVGRLFAGIIVLVIFVIKREANRQHRIVKRFVG